MSQDSDRDGFLSRWARRKALARDDARAPEPGDAEVAADGAPVGEAPDETPEAFDLASLPGLDDIDGATNLSDFLRKEVPEALRNAAMKRAWALDPAIRDYVNPALEYAFDWNVPGGVPGNGPMQAGFDAAKAVAQMFTKLPEEAEEPETPALAAHTLGVGEAAPEGAPPADPAIPGPPPAADPVRRPGLDLASEESVSVDPSDALTPAQVAQERTASAEPGGLPTRRTRHGGAAPT
ncbi:MAG: hypothetical protein JWN93_514 [Hyphomicrobiales bacterium]|nr:hypothetical protein [Hyphomicrobiales bacterium]